MQGIRITFDGNARQPLSGIPRKIIGLKAGIVGLGKSGRMVAEALHIFGADTTYFARSEEEDAKAKGCKFLILKEVLSTSVVVITCINKNTSLHHEA